MSLLPIESVSGSDAERFCPSLAEITHEIIVRNLADGVIVADANGRVGFMNRAAERLLGKTLSTVRGASIADVIRLANEDPASEAPIRALLAGGRVQRRVSVE